MKKFLISYKSILIFLIGAVGYGLLETAFRGFTHWSMNLTGGACLLSLYYINMSIKDAPIIVKAIIGAALITFYEFCVGLIVNTWLGLQVWDYSALSGNYMGLVCLTFSSIWFFICFILAASWRFFYNIRSNKLMKKEEILYATEEL